MDTNLVTALKKLREVTSLGVGLCKKALEETDGDVDLAIEFLKKSGELKASGLIANSTDQGRIFVYGHSNGRYGAMLELTCQTDFAANSQNFLQVGQDLVMQLAGMPLVSFISASEISEEQKAKQEKFFTEQLQQEQIQNPKKKIPPEKIPTILDGKMRAWYSEVCFLATKSLLFPQKTIEQLRSELSSQLGENVQIKRIARWER